MVIAEETEKRERKPAKFRQVCRPENAAKSASEKRKTPRGTWPCGVFQDDKERVFVEGSGGGVRTWVQIHSSNS